MSLAAQLVPGQSHLRLFGRALLSGETNGGVGINDIRTVLLTLVVLSNLFEGLHMKISTFELLSTTDINPPDRQTPSQPRSPCRQPA